MAYIIKDAQGKEVEHDGKKLHGLDVISVVKEVDIDKRTLRIVATDETPDRDGDVVRVKGWKLENYMKNPVFIWAHDYSSVPLAAAIKIERKRSPWRIVLSHRFPSAGINPFADMILALYAEKIINAGSVGFIPEEWKDINPSPEDIAANQTADGVRRRMKWGREFISQELLEHSGCAVPANPSALQESIKSFAKGFQGVEGNLLDLIVGKTKYLLDDKRRGDVQSEIEDIKSKGLEIEEETEPQIQVPANYSFQKPEEGKEVETQEPAEAEMEPFTKMRTLFEEVISQWFSESVADQADSYRKEFERLLKTGAVLNRKNKSRLKQAAELISEVLSEAEPEGEEEESGKDVDVQDQIDLKNVNGDSSEGGLYDSLFEDDKAEDETQLQSAEATPEKISVKPKTKIDSKKIDKIASMLTDISKVVGAIKI